MVFPPWFPVTIWSSQAHRCTWPARVCLDREEHHGTIAPHTSSHLARPPRRQVPTNQPTAPPTAPSDSCYCLLVTYTWWRIHGECSCWWFDDLMCGFFWIQKRVNTTVEGFKCGNRVLGQIAGISMGVQIGISRDCGIHRLLALLSLTMPQTSLLPKKILA